MKQLGVGRTCMTFRIGRNMDLITREGAVRLEIGFCCSATYCYLFQGPCKQWILKWFFCSLCYDQANV